MDAMLAELTTQAAVLRVYRQAFVVLAREAGAMILDADLIDVYEAILEAFAAAGSEGLTAAEVVAACHRFGAGTVSRHDAVADGGRASVDRLTKVFWLLANELTSLVQRGAAEAPRENAQLLSGNRSLIAQAEDVHAVVLGRWPDPGAAMRVAAYLPGRPLPAIDWAVLALVLIHSVAIPRSRGTLQGDARTSGPPPCLDLRWRDGLYLASGTTEARRAAQVDKMWQALPFSNGRTDFHASRPPAVLFGGHARCVSFLSTSVRSSPTSNLLAQPLNDLSAARIFDAIANLTGLDAELEAEQALRSKEHAHRVKVLEAEPDLELWQREIALVEAGIAQRRGARDQLGAARAAWQHRCARHLVDGLERADQIRAAISQLDHRAEELTGELAEADAQIDALSDDVEFARQLSDITKRREGLSGRGKDLDTEYHVTIRRLEELSGQHRQLLELARAADGPDQEVAAREFQAAKEALERALTARARPKPPSSGPAACSPRPRPGTTWPRPSCGCWPRRVPAVALLDVVSLDQAERPGWEPRLALYRDAVVVHRGQAAAARERGSALRPGRLPRGDRATS